MKVVDVEKLNLTHTSSGKRILENFSFSLKADSIHALIGESGSGKSSFAYSIFKLNSPDLLLQFQKYSLLGRDYDSYTVKEWEDMRGQTISMIPQNPSTAFHPYIKTGKQIEDFLRIKDKNLAKKEFILFLLNEVGIEDPESKYSRLPSGLSGGERQRIIIALTLALKPALIIADEPTTALDSINEKQILSLLYNKVKELKLGLLLITHDMRIVYNIADEITILRNGIIMEKLEKEGASFPSPVSEYGRELFLSSKVNYNLMRGSSEN